MKKSILLTFYLSVATILGSTAQVLKLTDAKFQKLSGDIYQKFADELTSEEKLEIAKYQTIYSALRGKAGLKNFGESLKEAAKKAQDALEENKD